MRKQGSEPTKSGFVSTKTSVPSTTIPKSKTETKKRAINNWIATVVLQSGFCSLDDKFKADLNINSISANLKSELDAKNFPLTASATVKEERTGKWTIREGNTIYSAYNEDERLDVYKCHNEGRLKVLSDVVKSVVEQSAGDGIILFPAGMIYTEDEAPSTVYNMVQETLIPVLKQTNDHVIVCAGVDSARDQIAISVDKTGIIAKGRKFYAARGEDQIELASHFLSEEDGKSRRFELNDTRYYMCVCYDIFGLRHKHLSNPGVDVVLNLVHCFYQQGKGPSGEPNFARHGLAGASNRWKCPVFAAAVFFKSIPLDWPSGVYWNRGKTHSQSCTYENISISPINETSCDISEGIALVRRYNLNEQA